MEGFTYLVDSIRTLQVPQGKTEDVFIGIISVARHQHSKEQNHIRKRYRRRKKIFFSIGFFLPGWYEPHLLVF